MFAKPSIALLAGALLASSSHAATEYLRFQGKIYYSYDESHSGYDATLGFSRQQIVYFDFKVDTELSGASPDSTWQDRFAVTYFAGSRPGPLVTGGVTTSFPEGDTTVLFVGNSLRVGSSWNSLQNPSDESIDTWVVGDILFLLSNGYMGENSIADLKLTYRGETLPPTYVPVPQAMWLFGSGMVGLVAAGRRRAKAV